MLNDVQKTKIESIVAENLKYKVLQKLSNGSTMIRLHNSVKSLEIEIGSRGAIRVRVNNKTFIGLGADIAINNYFSEQ